MAVKEHVRRTDSVMAEKVQYGISLLHVAGAPEAQRYLISNGISVEVIGRILSASPGKRRVYGTHLKIDC